MPRYCVRCKVELLKKNGQPDLRRFFCSPECKREDQVEKLHARRARQRCYACGQRIPSSLGFVMRNKAHSARSRAIPGAGGLAFFGGRYL